MRRFFLNSIAMLVLLSPAKKLSTTLYQHQLHTPRLMDQAQELMAILQTKSPQEIASLMKISDKLAMLNVARYQSWRNTVDENSSAAIFLFQGDVYQGLDAQHFDDEKLAFAQKHLRILSGLYGLLRPLDGIYPYRLEMGSKLANNKGNTLYTFWRKQVTEMLIEDMHQAQSNTLVNAASVEYAQVVDFHKLGAKIYTPKFLEKKNGNTKIIQFYAKKARGLLAKYIVLNNIRNGEDIRGFNYHGYLWNKAISTPHQPVFIRDH